MKLTPNQELAASDRGGARLVSAAAGSGKTAVLVERLMRYVDDGHDIDRFLVVTFTRAAAGEMRNKILRALNERAGAHPGDKRLRRQTELVLRANICTIDSYCGRLLREYAHLAHVAPDFRLVDEQRAEVIRREALDELLDDVYKNVKENSAHRALLDTFVDKGSDVTLSDLLLRLHSTSQSYPHPVQWLTEQREALRVPDAADARETVWGRIVLDAFADEAELEAAKVESWLRELNREEHEALAKAYTGSLAVTAEGLRELSRSARLGWDRAGAVTVEFPRPGYYRGSDEFKDYLLKKREKIKEKIKRTWNPMLSQDSATLLRDLKSTLPAMDALLELTIELEERFRARKRRLNAVDFSDQEHMVLELLEAPGSTLSAELSARFDEVLVDEYQDVNACQDTLFRRLSDDGRKLFMVGDVKQSIYRFRQADPSIFLEKYNEWSDTLVSGEPGRILLQENFRSRAEILEATNHVFANIMSPSLGELRYDAAAALNPGLAKPEGAAVSVKMRVLQPLKKDEEDEDEISPENNLLEARYVASEIRKLVEAKTPVHERDGSVRTAGYGDVAILLRSGKSVSPLYAAALTEYGVPYVSKDGDGFFKSLEISILLSLLQVIDNPHQDVALISALKSPLYGFSADDLAGIRSYDRAHNFYTALRKAAKEREDCRAFLDELEEYRSLSADLTVEALLGYIRERRSLTALLSAMPEPEVRLANVRALFDLARGFEADGYHGLFRFLRWLRVLRDNKKEPKTGTTEVADAVQIITVHHSKGLEYPFVFLANTCHQFNKTDLRSSVLSHRELGVGCKVIQRARGIAYPSLSWRAIREQLTDDMLSEEMRVLYVAMTRAREQLFITGIKSDAEKKLGEYARNLSSPLLPALLRRDESAGAWLMRTVLLPDSPIEFELLSTDDIPAPQPLLPELTVPKSSDEGKETKVSWFYPDDRAQSLPSKLTASGLQGTDDDDPDAADLPGKHRRVRRPRKPNLSALERSLSPAERGTAVHTVMQFIDYARCSSEEEIASEIARLHALGHLSDAQAKGADPAMILAFFRSKLGRRVLGAENVRRELRFSILADAGHFFPVPEGEQVLLQGVVDCCFEEDGELVIVDYKTDYVTADTLDERAREYAPQLRAYALALARMLSLPVREGALFFLRTGQTVSIPLHEEDN